MICINSYFASRVKAITAETRGAEALVPVNPSVHPPLRSIVVCEMKKKTLHGKCTINGSAAWVEVNFRV